MRKFRFSITLSFEFLNLTVHQKCLEYHIRLIMSEKADDIMKSWVDANVAKVTNPAEQHKIALAIKTFILLYPKRRLHR